VASVLRLSFTFGIVVFGNIRQRAGHQARLLHALAGTGLSFATLESRPSEENHQRYLNPHRAGESLQYGSCLSK
jgi:hypothetical protein